MLPSFGTAYITAPPTAESAVIVTTEVRLKLAASFNGTVICDCPAGPGSLIVNTAPTPILDPSSTPYPLCEKFHNLSIINKNVPFPKHSRHIQDGFSFSVC